MMRREADETELDEVSGSGGSAGWRDGLRILAAVLGIAAAVGTFIVTWRGRYEVEGGGDAAILRATLNSGLYLERLFVLGCVLVIIIAIYIATRTGE